MKKKLTASAGIAAGYVRVSRDKTKHGQADEIVSPETQREFFVRFAQMRGWQLPPENILEDLDYSGYRMHYSKRPGLMELMKWAEEGRFQYLMIYKISRLSRRLREFLEIHDYFEKHGIGVISVTESIDTSSPYGRAAMHMLAVFAQLQSEELSEYISNTQNTQARQGIMPGGRSPFGILRKGGKVLAHPDTFPVVEQIFELGAAGESPYKIAQMLREQKVHPPEGEAWWEDQVRRTLRNPVYIGKFNWDGRAMDGRHEALIKPELYYRAQRFLDERKIVQSHKRSRSLSGTIVCSFCGARFNVHHGGGNSKFRGYQCRQRFVPGCQAPRLHAESLEQEVERRLGSLVENPALLDAVEAKAKTGGKKETRSLEKEKARLEAELNEYKEMLDTLFEDYHRRRIITADQFAAKNREYLDRARELETELALTIERLANPSAERDAMRDRRATLAGLTEVWGSLPEEERAEILRRIGLRLVVHEDRVEMSLFGVTETIPGHAAVSSLYFGDIVTDLEYQGPYWGKAQEEYLLQNWPRMKARDISEVIKRTERSIRQKIVEFQRRGLLPCRRQGMSGKYSRNEV